MVPKERFMVSHGRRRCGNNVSYPKAYMFNSTNESTTEISDYSSVSEPFSVTNRRIGTVCYKQTRRHAHRTPSKT